MYNNGIGEVDFSSCDFEVTGNKKVDITAPELKSIKVDKKNVETGDVVTFTAEVTDDISGVKYVYVYLDIPGINRKQDIILEKKEDNIYEGSYTISENDANGTWKINWVYLSDKQGGPMSRFSTS